MIFQVLVGLQLEDINELSLANNLNENYKLQVSSKDT